MNDQLVIMSWKHLMEVYKTMNEDQLRTAINYEVSTYKRKAVIVRLHQRYAKLAAKREREELMNGGLL